MLEREARKKGKLDMDCTRREEILEPFFTNTDKRPVYITDIERFRHLDIKTLEQLLEEGFIEPEECQNFSPTTSQIYEFMKRYPGVRCHGYAVSGLRSDCRVTLEGVEFKGKINESLKDEFLAFSEGCDELYCNDDEDGTMTLYSWWD
jgi:hypothetical protein